MNRLGFPQEQETGEEGKSRRINFSCFIALPSPRFLAHLMEEGRGWALPCPTMEQPPSSCHRLLPAVGHRERISQQTKPTAKEQPPLQGPACTAAAGAPKS